MQVMTGRKFVKNVLAGWAFLFEKKHKKVVLKQLVERVRKGGRKRKDVYACKTGNKLQVSIAFTHFSCGRSRGCGLVMDSKGEKNSLNAKKVASSKGQELFTLYQRLKLILWGGMRVHNARQSHVNPVWRQSLSVIWEESSDMHWFFFLIFTVKNLQLQKQTKKNIKNIRDNVTGWFEKHDFKITFKIIKFHVSCLCFSERPLFTKFFYLFFVNYKVTYLLWLLK